MFIEIITAVFLELIIDNNSTILMLRMLFSLCIFSVRKNNLHLMFIVDHFIILTNIVTEINGLEHDVT